MITGIGFYAGNHSCQDIRNGILGLTSSSNKIQWISMSMNNPLKHTLHERPKAVRKKMILMHLTQCTLEDCSYRVVNGEPLFVTLRGSGGAGGKGKFTPVVDMGPVWAIKHAC